MFDRQKCLYTTCWFSAFAVALCVTMIGCNKPNLGDTKALQKKYLNKEGHNARGPIFAKLVASIDSPSSLKGANAHIDLTERQVLSILGPPDFTRVNGEAKELVYLYDRFGKQDWYVAAMFESPRGPAEFGFNAVTELNMENLDKNDAPDVDSINSQPESTADEPELD